LFIECCKFRVIVTDKNAEQKVIHFFWYSRYKPISSYKTQSHTTTKINHTWCRI